MSTPNSAGTSSEVPAGTALTLYDDRQQVVLHTAIELWASASTGVETRRREKRLKNKQKIVRSFFDLVRKNPGKSSGEDGAYFGIVLVQRRSNLLRHHRRARPETGQCDYFGQQYG